MNIDYVHVRLQGPEEVHHGRDEAPGPGVWTGLLRGGPGDLSPSQSVLCHKRIVKFKREVDETEIGEIFQASAGRHV